MPQYDQWILLAVVSAVAALLVIVARQVRPPVENTKEAISAPVATPAEPIPALVPPGHAAPGDAAAPAPKRKRKKVKRPAARACAPTLTPIQAVLGMLKQKDALATAFVLREILDAPVSRRPR
ncbi:MAG: hypothetical protein HYX68_08880 [Planctomycetes bacterium]|nr:hypothetical protein [Planctomycetota bacterium]